MQFTYDLKLSDGERVLIATLLNKYIDECKKTDTQAGFFAENLQKKISELTF